MNKINATIMLTMNITQGNEHSKTSYETDAKFYFLDKDKKFFLFFDEEFNDASEVTKCRFEIDDESLRMRRRGPIVIEQKHVRGQKTVGYIKTPFGHVDTNLQTFKLSFTLQPNGHYELDLGYHLSTGNEKTGTYLLNISIVMKEEIIS